MKESIKIDIIYFQTERDTRMEFMFKDSGELPIRLLSSSAADRTEFLYALKRAVFRSDTVIIVGGMNERQYLPGLLSSAIGVPCVKVDYRALGFEESEKPLMFPNKSIPLVTPDREIGGFLIEKGRQSIIMVSENFDVRHKLLDQLVLPYVLDSRRVTGATAAVAEKPDRADNVPATEQKEAAMSGEQPTDTAQPADYTAEQPESQTPEQPSSEPPAAETDANDLGAQLATDRVDPENNGEPDNFEDLADDLQRLIDSLPEPSNGFFVADETETGEENESTDEDDDGEDGGGRGASAQRYINIGAAAALIIAGLALAAAIFFKLI